MHVMELVILHTPRRTHLHDGWAMVISSFLSVSVLQPLQNLLQQFLHSCTAVLALRRFLLLPTTTWTEPSPLILLTLFPI